MSDTSGVDPNVQNFFWADAANDMTIDQLKARRAVAAALASRSRPYPKTFGEGLSSAAEGITQGLYDRQLLEAERAQQRRDEAQIAKGRGATPPAVPTPPAGPAGGSALLDMPSAPVPTASLASADMPPEVDAGRSAIAQTAAERPGLLQMAALDTGTVSDAGQPGATYGGPQAAGPGATIAERPDVTSPDQSIAAGRDSLVPTMLAQAGQRGNVEVRPTPTGRPPGGPTGAMPGGQPGSGPAPTPAPGPFPPQGTPIKPGPELGPGGARINMPKPVEALPPEPKVGIPTPEMQRLRSVLDDPRNLNRLGERARAELEADYKREEARRDKIDSQQQEIWQKKRDDILTRRKEYDENIRQLPKQQSELEEKAREAAINRDFRSPENYKAANERAAKSMDQAKMLADNLNRVNEAVRLLNSRNIIAGIGTDVNLPIPGVGNVPLPSGMTLSKVASAFGSQRASEEVRDTEHLHAKLYPLVGQMLAMTTGRGNVTEKEGANAAKAIGLDPNLDLSSQQRIVNGLREDAVRMIQDHNRKVRETFNPQYDQKALQQYTVPIQFDPADVNEMKRFGGAPRPQEVQMFERRYGPGSAARALRGETE